MGGIQSLPSINALDVIYILEYPFLHCLGGLWQHPDKDVQLTPSACFALPQSMQTFSLYSL